MSEVFANLNFTNLRSNNYFAAKNIDLTISLENEFRQSKNIKTTQMPLLWILNVMIMIFPLLQLHNKW